MPARAAASTCVVAVSLLGGCSTPHEPTPGAAALSFQVLVPLEGWSEVSRDADPFIKDPSAAPACVGPGFRLEPTDNWLEIDTGACNWVTLSGSALSAVSQGQQLELTVSHYNLEAPAPAEAQLSLRFGACDVWSKVIPIPEPAAVYTEQFGSPCALELGGSVLFHLNNHGQNTYQLQELSSQR